MCGRRFGIKSRVSLLSLVLCFLLSFSPSYSSCYAEVILTDEEAMELMNEIQESKKDLENARNELTEQKKELEVVKNTYNEQKTSYEEQLTEAKKENKNLKTGLIATSASSIVLLVVTIIVSVL